LRILGGIALVPRDALPGEGLPELHQDAHADPPPYGCNSVWMLDDFSPENGCTRLVPGSCRRAHPRQVLDDPKAPHTEEELMADPAGSVAVFNAYTLTRTRDPHRPGGCCHGARSVSTGSVGM
jgi:ectoine hydroxylase-related dioxygenase (phytanoyl-CoA dioxygenase family)